MTNKIRLKFRCLRTVFSISKVEFLFLKHKNDLNNESNATK